MFGNGFYDSNGAFPLMLNPGNLQDNNMKMAHDCYEVYVNGDYVGRKALIVQGENAKDVESYLKEQGFHNFNTKIQADNIIINSIADEASDIKRNLNVYLNIR